MLAWSSIVWVELECLYMQTGAFTFTFDKIPYNKTKADEDEVDDSTSLESRLQS